MCVTMLPKRDNGQNYIKRVFEEIKIAMRGFVCQIFVSTFVIILCHRMKEIRNVYSIVQLKNK